MTTEEQLINDILILEERKERFRGNTLKESLIELDKLTKRQIGAVEEYVSAEREEVAIKLFDDKEIEKERQLQKEKYTSGSLSQNAYSEGFIDAINWLKRKLFDQSK